MALAIDALYGITVTIPADTNAHRLVDLLAVTAPELANAVQCRFLMLQGGDSNITYVFVGDANVSAARHAYSLLGHDSNPYHRMIPDFPLIAVYVAGQNGGEALNVEVIF